ncbi:MAG: hypothetical protein V2B18_19495 [Pseudomonadota bacterium]
MLIPAVIAAGLTIAGCAAVTKSGRPGSPFFDFDQAFVQRRQAPQESWKAKGLQLVKEKRYHPAIEAFKHHVEDEPEDFFGYNAMAVCYKNLRDHAASIKNYERALELVESPEEKAKVLANIGNLYFNAHKLQAALGFHREAHAEFERNPVYLVLVARTFMALKEFERARKVLKAVEQSASDMEKYENGDDAGTGFYLVANCYAALGQEEEVINALKRAMKANPGKYAERIATDLSDEQSLFFTLRDDPRIKRILDDYRNRS